MFEKLWGVRCGTGFSCLVVSEANSRAIKRPRIVIIRAASFSTGCIVITGVFKGTILEEIRKPPIMLPHARRLMGFISIGSFSLMGARGKNRGCPIGTKYTTRRL